MNDPNLPPDKTPKCIKCKRIPAQQGLDHCKYCKAQLEDIEFWKARGE